VIYLIFFKPYTQEEAMMDAMAKENITGMEQSKNSLLKYANEGLEALKGIKGFDGDNSLVENCRAVLNFYVKEAEKMKSTSDYFLAKERFETMKKEFAKKSRPDK